MTKSPKTTAVSLAVWLILALVASACGSTAENSGNGHRQDEHFLQEAGRQEAGHQTYAPNGDLRETTASVDELPSFLDKQPEEIRIVYAAAGKAADILQWIPCYCGCGESAGHASSYHCFVHRVHADGSVVWDDHGTRCGVCLQIAAESITMDRKGYSIKEIRDHIDQTYQEGYAAPTDTKMPE